MYISNLFIKNYKSLRDFNIEFHKDKNVIVGKNNAGKSNVITALDILFNEKSPVYKNFNENDFYTFQDADKETGEITEVTAEYFFICATIEGRDFCESELRSIIKSTAFSKFDNNAVFEKDKFNEININVDFLTSLEVIENSEYVKSIQLINKNGNTYTAKTSWLKADDLLTFLCKSKNLRIFFCKNIEGENGYGIMLKDDNGDWWISHFLSNKLRDSIITTAIIPAFRNPKDELRLTYYTWYGKLIKSLWDKGKDKVEDDILTKSKEIKDLADKVFKENTIELKELLRKAIYHNDVSFKLIDTKKHDLYKSLSIHVDDGIDRPIEQKGSGIQSAIIISLFTSYCSEFHNTSSLLIAEEPELFLHPQARRVMSNELEKYLQGSKSQNRQLIISTHSTEFIRNTDVSNIVILRKNKEKNETKAYQLKIDQDLPVDEINKIIRFIWSKNAELFFADKVILVEGGEEYLVPAIFDKFSKEKQCLDYLNISVARVDGKGNFSTYAKILNRFSIPWSIIGDLDCYDDILNSLLLIANNNNLTQKLNDFKQKVSQEVNLKKLNKEVIKNPESLDGKKLNELFQKVKLGTLSIEDESLKQFIEYLEFRFCKNNITFAIQENQELEGLFNQIQSDLKSIGIHILSKGDLETYYTEIAHAVEANGKDNKALEIAGLLSTKSNELGKYLLYVEEWKLIYEKILEIE